MDKQEISAHEESDIRISLIAILILLVLCIFTGFLSLAIIESGLTSGLCGNDIIKEEPSPSGKYKAIAFLRSCGATTALTAHVSILPRDEELPNEEGNVFIGSYPSTFVGVRWENDFDLLVLYEPSGEPISRQEHNWLEIQIRYETTTP